MKGNRQGRESEYVRLSVLPDTDDDVDAVVTGVETLTVALRAVTDEGEGVVLEVLLQLRQRPVSSLEDGLLGTGKVEGLDSSLVDEKIGRIAKGASMGGERKGRRGGNGNLGRRGRPRREKVERGDEEGGTKTTSAHTP
jgi:hypothetical protein